jgi:DNA-directed RNA polymerase specialized sigma subunit
MSAKEYLSQALWLDQKINSKLEQLEALRTLATKVSANLTVEKVSGGSSTKSHMENTIAKIVDLEKEINQDIDRLVDIKADIIETINQVEDPFAQIILELRYINGKNWGEVAGEIKFDIRTAFRLHGKALKEIEEIKKCQ